MAFGQPRLMLTTAAPFSSAYSSAVSTRDGFEEIVVAVHAQDHHVHLVGREVGDKPAVAVPWPLTSVISAVALAKS